MTTKQKLPAKMGRPTKYTPELAERFCDEIAKGASVNEICQREGWPSAVAFYRWINQNEDFRNKYCLAREIAADRIADEIISIADGKLPMDGIAEAPDSAVRVSRDTARIKARMWQAGRMAPRKWGDL